MTTLKFPTTHFNQSRNKVKMEGESKRPRDDGEHPLANPLLTHITQQLHRLAGRKHVEVEARLCLHCTPQGGRLKLPIETATVLMKSSNPSVGVSKKDFDAVATAYSEMAGLGGCCATTKKTRDVRKGDLRETTDVETGQLIECCKKKRLFVVDILCPRAKYDLRIAFNEELPAEAEPSNSHVTFTRDKNRTSYTLKELSLDLTVANDGKSNTYEVELDASFEDASEISPLFISTLLDKSFKILSML